MHSLKELVEKNDLRVRYQIRNLYYVENLKQCQTFLGMTAEDWILHCIKILPLLFFSNLIRVVTLDKEIICVMLTLLLWHKSINFSLLKFSLIY